MVSKSGITLFNPEDTPAVYDEAGHTVGGAERVEVSEVDAVGQRAIDAGVLVREEGEGKAEMSDSRSENMPEPAKPVTEAQPPEKVKPRTGASSRDKTS